MTTHSGSCHWDRSRSRSKARSRAGWPATARCASARGSLLWFVPRTAMRVAAGEDALATYTFNKHVVRHRFCPTCGDPPVRRGRRPGWHRDGRDQPALHRGHRPEAVPVTHYDGRAR